MQKNEWAFMTGASSGIGRAFAEALAQRGLNLFLVALAGSGLSDLAQAWANQYQIETAWLELDLAQKDALEKIRKEIERKDPDVSIAVNAAGFGYFGAFSAMTPEQIDGMIKVNVLAVMQLSLLFLERMKQRGSGTLINIASIAGHLPYPYAAVYAAAKSSVHSFTRAVWAENQNQNIRIVSLSPGHTKTNFDSVSKEPDSIHLFPDEHPRDIAEKTLAHLSGKNCTFFTRPTHPLKIFAARLLPIKVFAWMLRRLMHAKS